MNKLAAIIVLVFSVSICYAKEATQNDIALKKVGFFVSIALIASAGPTFVSVPFVAVFGLNHAINSDLKPKKRNNRNTRSGR